MYQVTNLLELILAELMDAVNWDAKNADSTTLQCISSHHFMYPKISVCFVVVA
jgi:hypothetical protein